MLMRLHVSGAGISDVNGKYDVCRNKDKFPNIQIDDHSTGKEEDFTPSFMFWHKSNTSKHEFGMFLAPRDSQAQEESWVIARIDWKRPVVFYTAKHETSAGNVPPASGWVEVAGLDPCPVLRTEIIASPKKSALKGEEEVPQEILEKALFGDGGSHGGGTGVYAQDSHSRETKALYEKQFAKGGGGKKTARNANIKLVQPPMSDMNRRVGQQ